MWIYGVFIILFWNCGGAGLEFMLFLMFDLCCGIFIYGFMVL